MMLVIFRQQPALLGVLVGAGKKTGGLTHRLTVHSFVYCIGKNKIYTDIVYLASK